MKRLRPELESIITMMLARHALDREQVIRQAVEAAALAGYTFGVESARRRMGGEPWPFAVSVGTEPMEAPL